MKNQRYTVAHSTYYRPVQSETPAAKKHSVKRLGRIVVFVLVVGLIYHFGTSLMPGKDGESSPKVAASAPAIETLSTAQINAMQKDINAIITANPEFDTGVAVQDLNSGKTYTYGENQPYIAASVSKVLTAVLYLHEVEQGDASLSDQVGDSIAQAQIQKLIENSDNDAWQALNELLSHDKLKAYANQIGLENYDPDDNTLTVDTIATLYGKLYKNKLLNNSDTKLLLSYMKNANETEYIAASIPDNVTVYHKAGWLEDRIHDAAIIDNGKHPYVLVIFTKVKNGTYDTAGGQQIFANITKATTTQFLQQ